MIWCYVAVKEALRYCTSIDRSWVPLLSEIGHYWTVDSEHCAPDRPTQLSAVAAICPMSTSDVPCLTPDVPCPTPRERCLALQEETS